MGKCTHITKNAIEHLTITDDRGEIVASELMARVRF